MTYAESWGPKPRRRVRRPPAPCYHFGIGERKPLRGFPEGEPVIFESARDFTRVQILTEPDPAKLIRNPDYRRTHHSPPPCTDPPCREFFVKVSDDGEWWEPGPEITPPPADTISNNQ